MSGTRTFHLLGYPGVGKLTVAHALAELAGDRGIRVVIVDNHLTSLPILAVLDHDGTSQLPDRTWELVGEVRDTVQRAICELAPPDLSFVFTNVIVESDPQAASTIDRVRSAAHARDSDYAPVLLTCDRAEHRRRVAAEARKSRRKWTDADAVEAFIDSERLVRPVGLTVELDVTALDPMDAAAAILEATSRSG